MPSIPDKNAHCGYCGTLFPLDVLWPRTCIRCSNVSYRNPMPVALLLLPTHDRGLVVTERGIDPGKGCWALTSGFMELNETPEEAGVRELREETGIIAAAGELEPYGFSKTRDLLLVFLLLRRLLRPEDLAVFAPVPEVAAMKTIYRPETLAFSAHTLVVERYFAELARKS